MCQNLTAIRSSYAREGIFLTFLNARSDRHVMTRKLRVKLHCPFCHHDLIKEIVRKDDAEAIYETCPQCNKHPMVIEHLRVLGD